MSDQESRLQASDAELLERARSGDSDAFAELWRRHYRSAARVARQFTSSIDADDLVSEAYVRIFQRVLAGGGPTGAFRPYLYTTVRNLASTWGAASHDINVDEIDEIEDDRLIDDPAVGALDRTLTARAFRSLPDRWQTVLWYTEIEGMDPHEVAPLMGLTANGVAALSYRAREGLRTAWLQAHVSDATEGGECEWALAHLGGRARNGLSSRDDARLTAHLASCTKCAIISEEVEEVGSHLAMVMIPILLGGVVGGAVLSQLAAPSGAVAATIPAVPTAFQALAAAGPSGAAVGTGAGALAAAVPATAAASGLVGAASGAGAVLSGLALVAVIGGTAALSIGAPVQAETPSGAESSASAPLAAGLAPTPTATTGPSPADLPADLGGTGSSGGLGGADSATGVVGDTVGDAVGTVGSVVDGVGTVVGGATGVVGDTVGTVVGGVTPTTAPPGQAAPPAAPVTTTIALSGRGTPGATVAAQVAGVAWLTTKVGADGRWSLRLDAVPTTAGSVTLTQTTTGLVGGLLGGILTPLSLDTGPLGVVVNLLG